MTLVAALSAAHVVGVTTVFGNVGVAQATANVRAVLRAAGARADLPVVRGAAGPLGGGVHVPGTAHGADGLGDCGLTEIVADDEQEAAATNAAAAFISAATRASPQTTILALGPLTNVAAALAADPALATRVAEVVWFGGAFFRNGTVNPASETNARADPDAADAVFASGVPVRVVGYNVTSDITLTLRHLAALPPHRSFLAAAARTYAAHAATTSGLANGAIFVHDPTALVAALHPHLFDWVSGAVVVQTGSGPLAGMTVIDHGDVAWTTGADGFDGATCVDDDVAPWLNRRPALVAMAADADAVRACVLDALAGQTRVENGGPSADCGCGCKAGCGQESGTGVPVATTATVDAATNTLATIEEECGDDESMATDTPAAVHDCRTACWPRGVCHGAHFGACAVCV